MDCFCAFGAASTAGASGWSARWAEVVVEADDARILKWWCLQVEAMLLKKMESGDLVIRLDATVAAADAAAVADVGVDVQT